jgi:hypothetical protein
VLRKNKVISISYGQFARQKMQLDKQQMNVIVTLRFNSVTDFIVSILKNIASIDKSNGQNHLKKTN